MSADAGRIVWGFLGETGTTMDGYRVTIWHGPRSRRYQATVYAPDGRSHPTDAPSTVDAKRAAQRLIDKLRAERPFPQELA